MVGSGRLWVAGVALAVLAGVGLALWRAPDTVYLPVGSGPDSLPAPMPAPPLLAAAPAALAEAPPPGVSAAQWQALRSELAGRPDELRRIADYFVYADQLQRFRERRAKAATAELLPLAQALDSGLSDRLSRNEMSAGEARLVKIALLEVMLADEAGRQAALSQWDETQRSAAVAPAPTAARDTEFQRRQAELVAAWSARPADQRDPRALERELDALRRASFDTPR